MDLLTQQMLLGTVCVQATLSHCGIHDRKGKSPFSVSLPVTNDAVRLDFGGHEGSTKQMMKPVQMARRGRVTIGSDK